MPVARLVFGAALMCALLTAGCRGEPPDCPSGTVIAYPQEIPAGSNQTSLTVEVHNPSPENGLEVVTELSSTIGTIDDPFALSTTYACPFDVSGRVEICVNTTYADGDTETAAPVATESSQKLRGPNVYLSAPLDCSTTRCATIVCPQTKNVCPEVSRLTVSPEALVEAESATITVVADDPDNNPQELLTTLSARHGVIAEPHARVTEYACDPEVGGIIEICVLASDGDPSCDVERCTTVRCPGDPLANTCPIIEDVTVTPMSIPPGQTTAVARVNATDPDEFPLPLRTEWSSETGVFGDRFESETTFTCGDSGPVKVCAKANDGDPECDETLCTIVQCPSDIPPNLCPQLFVINGIPRIIPAGQTSTRIETRGQDTDGLPLPLTLTLNTLWGSFENTENIHEPFNVVLQNATYICDRPGRAEVCVDATDGACTKTSCDSVVCPDDISSPP